MKIVIVENVAQQIILINLKLDRAPNKNKYNVKC